ncbi:hypothetical protein BDV25DRAFT_139293 [Aspergillus avenaceus]|uniref:Uncharacterized protein n=1 Tax=Aspergillus avenaceus TaxID=36643 RepID=A0A5N6TX48_ASPAV|nr:hypothetical protein BDV25DRAFT_139293 [Aspergillus avenaceus]
MITPRRHLVYWIVSILATSAYHSSPEPWLVLAESTYIPVVESILNQVEGLHYLTFYIILLLGEYGHEKWKERFRLQRYRQQNMEYNDFHLVLYYGLLFFTVMSMGPISKLLLDRYLYSTGEEEPAIGKHFTVQVCLVFMAIAQFEYLARPVPRYRWYDMPFRMDSKLYALVLFFVTAAFSFVVHLMYGRDLFKGSLVWFVTGLEPGSKVLKEPVRQSFLCLILHLTHSIHEGLLLGNGWNAMGFQTYNLNCINRILQLYVIFRAWGSLVWGIDKLLQLIGDLQLLHHDV